MFAIYVIEKDAPELESIILAEKPILTDAHIVTQASPPIMATSTAVKTPVITCSFRGTD